MTELTGMIERRERLALREKVEGEEDSDTHGRCKKIDWIENVFARPNGLPKNAERR